MSLFVPSVIENKGRGDLYMDVWTRLLKDRIVFVNTEVNHATASAVVAQLLYLASESSSQEIKLYINSPGGSVTDGLMIYDTMQYIKSPVSTICMGQAASMAAVLLASGAAGKRFSLPNASVLLHQPVGGFQGQASDIDIQAKEVMRIKKLMNGILVNHTGQPYKKIEQDTDRDFIMTAQQAKEYGIIDEIFGRKE